MPGVMIVTLEGQPGYSAVEDAAYAKASIEANFITSPALSTSAHGGKGTGFDGQTGDSMPNYLAWASGSTWGLTSDATATGLSNRCGDTPSLFSQAVSHHVLLLAFAENVTSSNVTTGAANDGYYSRHNAYSYFSHLEPSTLAPAINSLITVPAPGAPRRDLARRPRLTGRSPSTSRTSRTHPGRCPTRKRNPDRTKRALTS
jgi:hypothetical protein